MISKRVVGFGLVVVLAAAVGWWRWDRGRGLMAPGGEGRNGGQLVDLGRYDFDSLKKRGAMAGKFEWLGEPAEVNVRRTIQNKNWREDFKNNDVESMVFRFMTEGKWISGMINGPVGMTRGEGGKRGAVIMVRGYADKEGYYSGFGSWRVADRLAAAGTATVSLDFLGYGKSDLESFDMLAARFEKVTAVMDLLATVSDLPFVDSNKVGFWAHSNGGQIVLSALEILGGNFPASLWAPMTNPFPQSILDTAADLDDGGMMVRKAVADFMKRYDARRYAFENYYDWIKSPILIHQGTADEWCRVDWQQKVVDGIGVAGGRAEMVIYEGDDHNLSKGWKQAVERDIRFLIN